MSMNENNMRTIWIRNLSALKWLTKKANYKFSGGIEYTYSFIDKIRGVEC